MANLRANKIVSTTGSNAITGSVEFDGTGDYLSLADSNDWDITGDYTIEFWAKLNFSDASYTDVILATGTLAGSTGFQIGIYDKDLLVRVNSTQYYNVSVGRMTYDGWNHIAAVWNGSSFKIYLNGVQIHSGTAETTSTSTSLIIGNQTDLDSNRYFNGFISNLRIVKGTALYTQNFIPPTAELKNVPGTVLLCCQNPSSATQEATGKTITVNGNATARNFTPSVGFDGTVTFDGVTKISTENYFYLPTGNTEDRGRGRGVFGGGYVPGTSQNTIQFINIQSQGNAQDFGDLSSNMGAADGKSPVAASSATRALFASGFSSPGPVNTMEYVTIATTSNSVDFGDLATNRRDLGACSSSTRALFGGGTTTGSTNTTSAMDFVTIASLGNAVSFGTLTQARRAVASCSSPTRGIFGGGYITASPTATFSNRIDFVTIATTGNATTFGDLQELKQNLGSVSSSVRGIFAGGASPTLRNTIDFVTISTLGNAQDFGDLTISRFYVAACSNSIRGVFGGGLTPTHNNTMDFIVINSTGNAQDFGDLLSVVGYGSGGGCSDSHGGLG